MATPFTLTCPCCNGRLTIDPTLEAVIAHEEAPRPKSGLDLGGALSTLKGAAARREELFRGQREAEQDKGKSLEKKCKESIKKAKDMPDKPLNPMDMD